VGGGEEGSTLGNADGHDKREWEGGGGVAGVGEWGEGFLFLRARFIGSKYS